MKKLLIIGMLLSAGLFAQAPPYRFIPNTYIGANPTLSCSNGDQFFSIVTYAYSVCGPNNSWVIQSTVPNVPGCTDQTKCGGWSLLTASSIPYFQPWLGIAGVGLSGDLFTAPSGTIKVGNVTAKNNSLVQINGIISNVAYIRMHINNTFASFEVGDTSGVGTPVNVTKLNIGENNNSSSLASVNFGSGWNSAGSGGTIWASLTPTLYTAPAYATNSNCSSSASPAVCGSSSAGAIAVPTSGATLVVNTSAVTADSQILLTPDESLGTKLGVTCNTGSVLADVSARTAGVSFTVELGSSPMTNPACYSYLIIN